MLIEKLLEQHDLLHRKDEIMATLFPCVKIIPTPTEEVAIGRSKFGGTPDFPKKWNVPTYKNKPLQFIAQLQLADVPAHETFPLLPKTGLLYFFFLDDGEEGIWGEATQKGAWRVLHYDGPLEETVRGPKSPYTSCALQLELTHKLPELFMEDEAEGDRFLQVLEALMPDQYDNHQMFGTPFSIQNEVFDEMEEQTGTKAEDFVLLLQIDSDWNRTKMQWADMGMLYFAISKEALANEQFEQAWCILQSS